MLVELDELQDHFEEMQGPDPPQRAFVWSQAWTFSG